MYEVYGGYAILPKTIGKNISIAIENDRIIDVGKASEIRKKYKFVQSIGNRHMILSPGFVDAHLHSYQIATKGLTIGNNLLSWLKKYIWKWEAALTKETAAACARVTYLGLLKSGVTSFVDYTSVHHTEEAFRVAESFGLRATIGKTLMDRKSPPGLQEDTDSALKQTENLIRKYNGKSNGRLRSCIIPRFGITCTDDLLEGCVQLSKKHKTMLTTHVQESKGAYKIDRKNYGASAVKHYHKIGLLGPRTLLVHGVWLSSSEIDLISKTKTSLVHCPGSNLMLGSGIADIPAWVRKKIKTGLGSDMAAYYNMSMFDQMRLACLIQNIKYDKPSALSPAQALNFATSGGAKAIGIKETGSLAPGKKADIILLNTKNSKFSPLNDIKSQIVFSASPSVVDTVICDGKVLMKEGKARVIDEDRVLRESNEILGSKFSSLCS